MNQNTKYKTAYGTCKCQCMWAINFINKRTCTHEENINKQRSSLLWMVFRGL